MDFPLDGDKGQRYTYLYLNNPVVYHIPAAVAKSTLVSGDMSEGVGND